MSAPQESDLCTVIDAELATAKTRLRDRQPFLAANWKRMVELHAATDQLFAGNDHPARETMAQLLCVHAADILLRDDTMWYGAYARQAIDLLQNMVGRGYNELIEIQLYVYLALLAQSEGKTKIAAQAARNAVAVSTSHCRNPLTHASILLVCGEVGDKYEHDQRPPLLQALRALKSLPARTDDVLLLTYRARVSLTRLSANQGEHLRVWWQGKRAGQLERELRYGRRITLAQLEEAAQRWVPAPLMAFD